MAVLARRPFRYAGRDLQVDDPVVGLDGERPEGGLFNRLLNSGLIYVTDDTAPVAEPAQHRQAERAGRQRRNQQAAKADGDKDV